MLHKTVECMYILGGNMKLVRFIEDELNRTNVYLHQVKTSMDTAFDLINDIRYNKINLNTQHKDLILTMHSTYSKLLDNTENSINEIEKIHNLIINLK